MRIVINSKKTSIASRSLIITGMQASGTSLIAQAFFRAGFYLGRDFMPPKHFNRDGVFEERHISRFHDDLLRQNQTNCQDYQTLKSKPLNVRGEDQSRAKDIIRTHFEGCSPQWGWKDPDAVLFLDLWRTVVPHARFLFIYRRPEEVVWSLIRRRLILRGERGPYVERAVLYLNLWTLFNSKIVEFVTKYSDQCLLLQVPSDIRVTGQGQLNKWVREKWDFDVSSIDFAATYKGALLKSSVPLWIRSMASTHRTCRRILRKLHRLRKASRLHETVPISLPGSVNSDKVEKAPRKKKRNICVVYPNSVSPQESFIRPHIEKLPANIRVLSFSNRTWGLRWAMNVYKDGATLEDPYLWLPTVKDESSRLLSDSIQARVKRVLLRCITRPASDLVFLISAIKSYLKKNRIEAVLAEYGPPGVSMAPLCRELGIPLIVAFHGYDAYWKPLYPHYADLFKSAAALVACSKHMENQLCTLGADRKKVHYNPLAVDTDVFCDGAPADAPPTFLSVARFVDKKAPHLTILAFKRVVDRIKNARLIMAGEGPLREACMKLAEGLGIGYAVNFKGKISHIEIALLMRKARAFVQHSVRSSYDDMEGTAVSVLEAGATGIPIVATRHPGISDSVVEGKTGFLVDEEDVGGMAAALIRLCDNPEIASKMGKEARLRIKSLFSIDHSISALDRIIKESIHSMR